MLEKLKKLFKIVNFSGSIMLKDGTEILLDGGNLEVGVKCFVELPNADEPIQLPDGEYTLEDGSVLIVVDGMIKEIQEPKTEEEIKKEDETEVVEEAEVEVVEEPKPEEAPVEEPADLEMKIKELEDRLTAIESALMEKQETLTQATQKLEGEFNTLKEKIETTDGAQKLSVVKQPVDLTPQENRLRNIKNLKK